MTRAVLQPLYLPLVQYKPYSLPPATALIGQNVLQPSYQVLSEELVLNNAVPPLTSNVSQ